MSNYNLTLQSNNTDLQAILNTINELPEANIDTTPVISVNSSTGLITVTAGTKTSTHQLAFKAAETITPGTVDKTIASGRYLIGTQTIKGDANLVAENIKTGVSIFGVSGNYVGGGSGEDNYGSSIMVSYVNSISDRLFVRASELTTAIFPTCTTIGNSAFRTCMTLTTISFPVATNIGDNAFYCCYNLTTAIFPSCINIGASAFEYCDGLTTIKFPVATTIGAWAFNGCVGITTALFPSCTTINDYAFNACDILSTAIFPACTSIGNNAFYACKSLTKIRLPMCNTIGSKAFYNCCNISSITLGASSVCKLSHSNAFSSTPYAGYSSYFSGTPRIYVPASLVDSYKTAANWSYYSSYFSAIGSNLITFIIDTDYTSIEYQAEEGMTWADWVYSEYNTDGWQISNNYVYDSSFEYMLSDSCYLIIIAGN